MNEIILKCTDEQIKFYIEKELNNIKMTYDLMRKFEITLREKEQTLKDREEKIIKKEKELDILPDKKIFYNKIYHNNNVSLDSSIEQLQLDQRVCRCLLADNIKTVSDLINCTPKQVLSCSNLGKKSLMEIKAALADFGLHLKE